MTVFAMLAYPQKDIDKQSALAREIFVETLVNYCPGLVRRLETEHKGLLGVSLASPPTKYMIVLLNESGQTDRVWELDAADSELKKKAKQVAADLMLRL